MNKLRFVLDNALIILVLTGIVILYNQPSKYAIIEYKVNALTNDTVGVEIKLDSVLSYLKKYEGLRLTPYQDGNKLAIGYGHRCNITFNSITKYQADSLLKTDYIKRLNYVKKVYKLTGNKAHAIACFIYNCGEGTLINNIAFNRALIKQSDISKHILKYCNYNGLPHTQLLKRRNFELNLYNS